MSPLPLWDTANLTHSQITWGHFGEQAYCWSRWHCMCITTEGRVHHVYMEHFNHFIPGVARKQSCDSHSHSSSVPAPGLGPHGPFPWVAWSGDGHVLLYYKRIVVCVCRCGGDGVWRCGDRKVNTVSISGQLHDEQVCKFSCMHWHHSSKIFIHYSVSVR